MTTRSAMSKCDEYGLHRRARWHQGVTDRRLVHAYTERDEIRGRPVGLFHKKT